MQLRWNGEWLTAPAYTAVPGALVVDVEATAPLVALGDASGRTLRKPRTKLVRFLLNDGPRSTVRKVRSKLAGGRFTGDYHVVAVLGRDATSGKRVAGVACRVPACSGRVLLHEDLAREVADSFGESELERFAAALLDRREVLEKHGRQAWLYSGSEPPEELRGAVADALARPASGRRPEILRPPAEGDGSTLLAFREVEGARRAAVLGAGDYVRTEVVPALRAAGIAPTVICDRGPQIAALAGRDLGFGAATTDAVEAIESLPDRSLVIVATAHDSHAELAATALDAGHDVVVEKPAVVTFDDLDRLTASVAGARGGLEVGFNRRHHPLVDRARRAIAREQGPATVVCHVREVELSSDHWYLWPNQGTRVTGNLCHWIDLAIHLMNPAPLPVEVSLSPPAPGPTARADEERVITATFEDGSIVCIVATARGDDVRGVQELIEVRRGTTTVRLDDLHRLTVLRDGRARTSRTAFRNKGHQTMYRELLGRLEQGTFGRYPVRDLVVGAVIQIAASELVASGGTSREVAADCRRLLAGTRSAARA